MSALQYRINARNALTGRTHLAVAYPSSAPTAVKPDLKRSSAPPTSTLDQVPKLMFASQEYRVLESQKGLRVMVHCTRCASIPSTFYRKQAGLSAARTTLDALAACSCVCVSCSSFP